MKTSRFKGKVAIVTGASGTMQDSRYKIQIRFFLNHASWIVYLEKGV